MEKRVVVLRSRDPYWNLAVEEHLLNSLSQDERILILFINGPAVVIGKHQNPWLEVNLPELSHRNVSLVRRISGGGTVFHDPGNLNFSFLGPKKNFSRWENLSLVSGVLEGLGVSASISEKYDLYAQGMKISGNAFCYRRNSVLHHGTLLVNTDLEALRGLLTPPALRVETHAVRSRSARTTNLSALNRTITLSSLIDGLSREFAEDPDIVLLNESSALHESVPTLRQRNGTWDWLYGRTPDFRIAAVQSSGETATIQVKKGYIAEITGPSWSDNLVAQIDRLAFCRADIETIIQEGDLAGEAAELLSVLRGMTI